MRPVDDAARRRAHLDPAGDDARSEGPTPQTAGHRCRPLIDGLEDDPAVRRRRRLRAGAVELSSSRPAGGRGGGAPSPPGGRTGDRPSSATTPRWPPNPAAPGPPTCAICAGRSFEAFDAVDRARGEELWQQALAAVPEADGAFQRAERAYETALVLDGDRADARRELADLS